MSRNQTGQLDTLSLVALLVGANYGLGFVLGTGEEALTQGSASSLYAVSIGIGMLALAPLSKFYWAEEYPIWILLGNRYGNILKILVKIISWIWMVGILAAQILGGAFILKYLGLSLPISMVTITIIFIMISLLSIEKVGRIFKAILVVNFLILIYCLWRLDSFSDYLQAPLNFFPALEQIPISYQIGIFLTKLLSIPIDQRLQIFTIQAKNPNIAYRACILSGIIIIFLAFVPSTVAIAAKDLGILPSDILGKEVIPYVFSWVGGGMEKTMGIVFVLCLLLSALGAGSSLLRGMNQIMLELNLLPDGNWFGLLLVLTNACLGLTIAYIGGSLISLMVSFYALYVAAILVPFIAYFFTRKEVVMFSGSSVKLSLIFGAVAGIVVMVITFIFPESAIYGSQQLSILLMGVGFSVIALLAGQTVEKFSLLYNKKADI